VKPDGKARGRRVPRCVGDRMLPAAGGAGGGDLRYAWRLLNLSIFNVLECPVSKYLFSVQSGLRADVRMKTGG